MILDTSCPVRRETGGARKQVKPLEQVMKEAFICREREGIKREDIKGGKTEQAEDILFKDGAV